MKVYIHTHCSRESTLKMLKLCVETYHKHIEPNVMVFNMASVSAVGFLYERHQQVEPLCFSVGHLWNLHPILRVHVEAL